MTTKLGSGTNLPGPELVAEVEGHANTINQVSWSPDGSLLASVSNDATLRLWDSETWQCIKTIANTGWLTCVAWSPVGNLIAFGGYGQDGEISVWDVDSWHMIGKLFGHTEPVYSLAWSPDGTQLASGSKDRTAMIWSIGAMAKRFVLKGNEGWVRSVMWSPHGRLLASGTRGRTARVWDAKTGKLLATMRHAGSVNAVAWFPDSETLASASNDQTIGIWNAKTGRRLVTLEGHTGYVRNIALSSDGHFLASRSADGSWRLWDCHSWNVLAVLQGQVGSRWLSNLAFHPTKPLIAIPSDEDRVIRIWGFDPSAIMQQEPVWTTVSYINAKVVLVGESSVGKTGLGIRIAEQRFYPTESTHGAHLWQVSVPKAVLEKAGARSSAMGELTLWDLAGQSEYRLVHQLFLDDTDAALLLFDCSNPADPFRGVPYWAKALHRQAPHAVKFLVAARCDVCPVTVDMHQINAVLAQYSIHRAFRTSAKTGEGVEELEQSLLDSIQWMSLPRTSTPLLFQIMRDLMLESKMSGQVLLSLEELRSEARKRFTMRKISQPEIDTVIALLQSRGLVYRLQQRSLILLWPELINQYASALVILSRSDPDGLGTINERDALMGNLPFTGFKRLEQTEERIVLESTVALLINHELCFREMGLLVFPSQINVVNALTPLYGVRSEVDYRFSGAVEAIYASLVVRMTYTRYFKREGQWRYAAEFSRNDGRLGFSMRELDESTSQLGIYFDAGVDEFDRVTFIRFVTDHLRARGVDLQEHIRLYCSVCGKEVENREAIEARIRSGKLEITCQYCDTPVLIPRSIEEKYRSDHAYQKKQKELAMAVDRGRVQEINSLKTDVAHYLREDDQRIHILHISDLHMGTGSEAQYYRSQIETDLKRELAIGRLEYLVITGDIARISTPEEYDAAFRFVNGLTQHFGLAPERVVVVPGNHDLSWGKSREAYQFVFKELMPSDLPQSQIIPAGEIGFLVCDMTRYHARFEPFSEQFYRWVRPGVRFPSDYADQAMLHLRPEDHILLLALNSAWEIDHHFRDRASINMEALSRALDQLQNNQCEGWLKIAVFHHPVTGREAMNDDFMQLLAVHGFQIVLHGHVHEAKEGFYKYDDKRGIHIIGAGTFGAPTREQVFGIPLQYNLLTLDPATRKLTVETRKKEKPDGAWMADARWGDKNNPSPRYTIQLK